MKKCNYNGAMGERIARIIFPALVRTDKIEDHQGIDGYLDGLSVQIKADERIAMSRNLYHEYWEKSYKQEPWRRSVAPVDLFLFITDGLWVMLYAHGLAKLEKGKKLTEIHPTSMGIKIPLCEVAIQAIHPHKFWVSFEEWQQYGVND